MLICRVGTSCEIHACLLYWFCLCNSVCRSTKSTDSLACLYSSLKTPAIELKTFASLRSVLGFSCELHASKFIYYDAILSKLLLLQVLTKNNFVLQLQQYLALEARLVGELLNGL